MTRLVGAVSDGQWAALAAVVVGSLAAVASVVTALISLAAKRSAEEKIGTPNGHGSVVQMMERLLAGQTGQDERLAIIEGRQLRQAERLGAIEHTQQTFCASVHGLETAIEDLPHSTD